MSEWWRGEIQDDSPSSILRDWAGFVAAVSMTAAIILLFCVLDRNTCGRFHYQQIDGKLKKVCEGETSNEYKEGLTTDIRGRY